MESKSLLDRVPMLVKAYGKWPSYAYLLVATVLVRGIIPAGILMAAIHWR